MERQAKDGTIYTQVGPDEWEMVTRQAKDGSVYKKVGMDEWELLESAAQAPDKRGFFEKAGSAVLDTISDVGEAIDAHAGAPTRAAIGALQEGKNPFPAFANQFGEDPSLAPTGQDIAKGFGVPDEERDADVSQRMLPSGRVMPPRKENPSKVIGTAIELTADPVNIIGTGLVTKGLRGVGQVADKTSDAIRGARQARQTAKASQVQSASAAAEAGARSGVNIRGGDLTVEQSGKAFEVVPPKSLDELKGWKPAAGQGELVGLDRLKQIEEVVPDLQTKPLNLHYKMMENPKAMKELKLTYERLPTEDAKKIAAYNQSIVDESAQKITQTVRDIGGGIEPRSLMDAGDDFVDTVKTKYNTEKEALAPAFQELQRFGGRITPEESTALVVGIGENTRLGKLLTQDQTTGRFVLSKNTPRSGLSDAEHSVLKRVIDDLNDGMSFKELQDTREFLRKQIDPANPGATSEIGKVRKILLEQMETMAARRGKNVGETFKAYAVNERNREAIERIIGGKIESLDALYSANPERVVKKIFANPNHAEIVAQYVGPEKMREMAASYIQSNIGKAFDSAQGFKPHIARNWINKNKEFIARNVGPEAAERLSALADYGHFGKQFLADVNPSGTAATILESLKPGNLAQKIRSEGITGTVFSETVGRVDTRLKQKQAIKQINELLDDSLPDLPEETRSTIKKALELQIQNATKGAEKLKDAPVRSTNAAIKAVTGNQGLRATAQEEKKDSTPPARPLKGPEKWANDGFEKLKKSGAIKSDKSALLKNPKAKRLLIQASDLSPNSKAMKNIVAQINKLEGSN